jgi:hypothetical protein
MAFTPNQQIAKEIEIREGYTGGSNEMVIVWHSDRIDTLVTFENRIWCN